MATTADIKNGLVINYNNDLFQIVEFLHVKPGKGPAFVRTKLRNLTTGRVIDNTFNSGVAIYPVRVERRTFQFLYKDEVGFNFMDTETFDQITLDDKIVQGADLMKEGQSVEVLINTENEAPLTMEMPPFVELEVTYAEPGIRGDTANSPKKPVEVETGAKIMVPLFIEQGEKIKIDTRTYDYVERVK
ncbi:MULTISPECIES: elongation factor P [unclassified Siphonobacter]|uniref:elongation factor P n=1 Tax=unclassified Siphonobacter TaxID=2635712 RepID=UPI000CC9C92D|nr:MULTISPECIES: elongation factor P [unclassified Siphonobacter]MDQ1086789.1 elongation factor P [Siphonobacter sp. SORGH_AS_1065]MDR6197041.1 elongation factor P [Siphonobacter sp. SORGH_AS_0500]PKK36284.1 elongation factor P [Siphonobacter sp. SORGH_AS_0500]